MSALPPSPSPSRPARAPRGRSASDAPATGRRERGKLDKRRRILEAAREVFIEHGYDDATTREIAARADVSIGTVFVYAKDKRDLLLQIVNDDLEAINTRGQAVLDRPGSVVERLLAYFRLRYRYWASEPRLARPALRETSDFLHLQLGDHHGEETQRFYSRRPLLLQQIEHMVRRAQASGEVAADVRPDLVASLVFSLYLVEARRWLSDETPRLAAGTQRLGEVLALFMRGILVQPAAPASTAAPPAASDSAPDAGRRAARGAAAVRA
jgi:AcrR family transcriptional regulator